MKIILHRDRCISAGLCVMRAPAIFDQDDIDGAVILRPDANVESEIGPIREAVAVCPAQAIMVSGDALPGSDSESVRSFDDDWFAEE